MEIKTYIIDAFTTEKFKGNPAGVCLLESEISTADMQHIATELNHSETAFIRETANNEYAIRYFTPTTEVPLCGHATLASSKLVRELTKVGFTHFRTGRGLDIQVRFNGESILMDFPLYPCPPTEVDEIILDGLGIHQYSTASYGTELALLLIELADVGELRSLSPNFETLMKYKGEVKEVVVTALSDSPEFDFVSRCFCPWIGINEDPVTGASHSYLTSFWQAKLGKKTMRAYQASRRGGSMSLRVLDEKTVEIDGKAVIVFKGNIEL